MTQDPRTVFEDYEPLFADYQQMACEVAARLESFAREAGIRPVITHRAKDMRSLIKKCLLYGGPIDLVPDKAGVKVVVRYASEVQTVNELIAKNFVAVSPPDVKSASYKPNELGYLGTHHQVKFLADHCPKKLDNLECEIIVHTGAETLWDSIAHELIWKPFQEMPSPVSEIS